ncbi:MAG TPA: tetratricopeptide repeat protein [Dongiaceae bacterium]|nr:tetratricopeptide repeat protein [Dongiaceae bacterium]
MKRLTLLLLALWLLPLAAKAQTSADDRYVGIYGLIQQGDDLSGHDIPAARAKYGDALTALKQFHTQFPNWQVKIVNFRLKYLADRLQALNTNTPPARVEAAPDANAAAQLQALREQLQQTQAARADLEKRLRDLASHPAPGYVNTQVLAQAETKIQTLEQENQKLRTGLNDQQARAAQMVDAASLQRLEQELVAARTQMLTQSNTIATLQQGNAALQKQLGAVPVVDTNALNTLRAQLQQAQTDKAALQAKLDALVPADPQQLAAAEEKISVLEKENKLLRAGLEQAPATTIELTNSPAAVATREALAGMNQKLQEQTATIRQLTHDRTIMQSQLDAFMNGKGAPNELERTRQDLALLRRQYTIQADAALNLLTDSNVKIARLQQTNAAALQQQQQLQNQLQDASASVTTLKNENESLRQQLAQTSNSAPPTAAADLTQLQSQMDAMRSQLAALQAKPEPFKAEELALLRTPAAATPAAVPAPPAPVKADVVKARQLIGAAQQLYAAGQVSAARDRYLEALPLDPTNVDLLANLATIELALDRSSDAEAHLEQALKVAPNSAFALGVLGNLRFRQGRYDEALEALSHAAQLNPNDAEIQNFLGVTLSQKGQRTAAEAALRRALQLNPEYGSAHNNLAVIYLSQNPPQVELARWHYHKALAAGQPRNADLEKMLDQAEAAAKAGTPEAKP